MMTQTPLDAAHAATEAAPDDDAARLAFYARLVEGEVFVLLTEEAQGDQLSPRVFELEDGPVVLAFDTEARLSEFTVAAAPYAALPCRVLVQMLVGSDSPLGMGLNLGVAPSSRLFPAEILIWLADTLANHPSELLATPTELHPPKGLPEVLLTAIDGKLARAVGLAPFAYLAAVTYEGGAKSHMLAFIDAIPGAEGVLARASAEALTFSGIEAGAIDVAFLRSSDPIAAKLARVGLRFDLPKADAPLAYAPPAPGMDPNNPPKLK
jgi:hypothetical protein